MKRWEIPQNPAVLFGILCVAVGVEKIIGQISLIALIFTDPAYEHNRELWTLTVEVLTFLTYIFMTAAGLGLMQRREWARIGLFIIICIAIAARGLGESVWAFEALSGQRPVWVRLLQFASRLAQMAFWCGIYAVGLWFLHELKQKGGFQQWQIPS